jgi:hypothetical protein
MKDFAPKEAIAIDLLVSAREDSESVVVQGQRPD